MHPGRFAGLSCNVGDPMTFRVLQYNTDLHKRNMVVHRGVVVLRNLSAMGYNSTLAPMSDAYLLEFHLEVGPP